MNERRCIEYSCDARVIGTPAILKSASGPPDRDLPASRLVDYAPATFMRSISTEPIVRLPIV